MESNQPTEQPPEDRRGWIHQVASEMARAPRPRNTKLEVSYRGNPIKRTSVRALAKQEEPLAKGYMTPTVIHSWSGLSPETLEKWRKAKVIRGKRFQGTWQYIGLDVRRAQKAGQDP